MGSFKELYKRIYRVQGFGYRLDEVHAANLLERRCQWNGGKALMLHIGQWPYHKDVLQGAKSCTIMLFASSRHD